VHIKPGQWEYSVPSKTAQSNKLKINFNQSNPLKHPKRKDKIQKWEHISHKICRSSLETLKITKYEETQNPKTKIEKRKYEEKETTNTYLAKTINEKDMEEENEKVDPEDENKKTK
jgi:hypothetical protein